MNKTPFPQDQRVVRLPFQWWVSADFVYKRFWRRCFRQAPRFGMPPTRRMRSAAGFSNTPAGASAFPNLERFTFGCLRLNRSPFGFTLAELLIALDILGVIATFTIPKVLQGQQDTKWKSIAKEAAAAMTAAYAAYRLNNSPTAGTGIQNLTPYLNYVKVDTTTWLDEIHGTAGPIRCGPSGGDQLPVAA